MEDCKSLDFAAVERIGLTSLSNSFCSLFDIESQSFYDVRDSRSLEIQLGKRKNNLRTRFCVVGDIEDGKLQVVGLCGCGAHWIDLSE